ncbi:unnamed protein product, partial [Polarella glacialis]
ERSVKEVTDRGRVEGAARLQVALEEALENVPRLEPPTAKRKATEAFESDSLEPAIAAEAAHVEAELRRDVRALLKPLQQLQQVRPSADSNAAALNIFRQLRRMQVSVDCLKATKIAIELNKPFWRGSQAAPEVRDAASSLVKSWRHMYRAQEAGGADGTSPAAQARKCRLLCVDLEEYAHSKCPKSTLYCRLIE